MAATTENDRPKTPKAVSTVIPKIHRESTVHAFLQGKCTKGKDCKYIHDKKALAVVKASMKAAWSKSSGSPSNTPRGGEPKAAPSVKAKAKASTVTMSLTTIPSVQMFQPYPRLLRDV